jgi:PD-(D/E)XK nuclease superfamily
MSVVEKLATFGVYPQYIRPSNLARLIDCPAQLAMSMDWMNDQNEGGAAAQLGSLVHKGVEAFHKADLSGVDLPTMVSAGTEALRSNAAMFPRADTDEAKKIFDCYSFDPRNWREVISVELPVEFYLDPHPSDKTGKPIYIKGTLDQYGLYNGYLSILDVKTGKPDGYSMLHEYAVQMSAYLLGALAKGLKVDRVYIIRTGGYRVRGAVLPSPDRIFWCTPLDETRAQNILDRVRIEVAHIRNGEVNLGPGSHCVWCEHGGLDTCHDKLVEFLQ